MAPTRKERSEATVPSELWTADDIPAPRLLDVLTQLAHFFDQIGYKKTLSALAKEASSQSELSLDVAAWTEQIGAKNAVPLLSLHEEWHEGNDKFPTLQAPAVAHDSDDSDSDDDSDGEKDDAEAVLVDVEAEETSDDDSDEKESSASDSSDSSSSEEEKEAPAKAGAKRKRVASPPSSSDHSSDASSSDSDSDSSASSESDAPPAKKARKSSPVKAAKAKKANKAKSSSSDSDSSSASSDSSSSSEFEEEKPAPPPEKKEKKAKAVKTSSAPSSSSSATLEAESSPEKEEAPVSHVHPDRLRQVPDQAPKPTTKKETAAQLKKQQIPFSRIPADQKVDEKFASNEYVSYDYADRAHRDLIVTRGKGFTKEKNKKKRGSYRGGTIDLAPKGIKFED
ncbi:hypothetical protein CLAFUW4_10263 [Fulvia fulva]|uniref:Srp40 C-terminal domain-containing protein n=1 Tax=Passalora fulva TaxID=5499 RepID=A0A9Q8LF78_PASFU|nr:uncharacterized protein CLAFUR5_04877 [Fulvia fulva]KAK4615930.1 hypothetical protein CLAFUR4_10267 [Fulvia fulva]KAK4617037.1 hypothetical protein CLAFUR0_10265 [Fulvia fulva]UJO16287.1 hypothetical protein CLAFUR5_04877 [Fulvia fulva]WPV19238.1 hypothetical protein CLAFUW4_10263 [Fulvia fulva]WPV34156.1 hypothetical protein CLAFUW7_10263 [Fulvia fulva]